MQALHRFEAERGGGIIKTKHVGRKVHKYVAHHWVAFRNFGEQLCKYRTKPARKQRHETTALAYLHHAEPKRKDSGQAERDLESSLGRSERRVHDGGKHFHIAENDKTDHRYGESDEKKAIQM